MANFTQSDAAALQALAAGEADELQQKAVLKWIVNEAARTHKECISPDGDRYTNFNLGARSVGLQIMRLVTTPLSKLLEETKEANQ